jgi:hypothetical protein
MMGAAKAVFKSGKQDAAIDAAICCQVHNVPIHDCLKANRAAISSWFKEGTK